jgi:hypothetical protein
MGLQLFKSIETVESFVFFSVQLHNKKKHMIVIPNKKCFIIT